MELRHLRSFAVTAELEHFGRAATRLGIVQPALSKQMRELEAFLGTPLFTRLPRGVRLTTAGRAFLDDTQKLLRSVELAAERARAVGRGQAGHLRIGFVDTALYHSELPRLFERFRHLHPGVQLELLQHPSRIQGEMLRQGELDVAFLFHRPAQFPALATRGLAREAILLAVPRRHRLARRRTVGLGELRDEAFVWIPRALSPPFHEAVFAACQRCGFTPHIVQEGETDLTILSLVAAGVGLSFCVASAAHRKPREVALIPISNLGLTMHLEAAWRTDHTNPALPHFLELLPRR